MGSLIAGWDHVSDPKLEKLRRNNSSTKDEIQAFWRSRKEEQEHLTHISNLSPTTQKRVFEEMEGDEPSLDKNGCSVQQEISSGEQTLIWQGWTSSDWAFLNEPPVNGREGRESKYVAQFHVAEMNTSKTDKAQNGVGA